MDRPYTVLGEIGWFDEYEKEKLKEFSNFLKNLLEVDLTFDEFEKMSEREKIEYRRNFKIDQITK